LEQWTGACWDDRHISSSNSGIGNMQAIEAVADTCICVFSSSSSSSICSTRLAVVC
jgi:hypothetical protein